MSKTLPGQSHGSRKTASPLAGSPQLQPYSLIRAMWKQKFAALGIWLAISVLTAVVVVRLPRTYQAEATVLVGNTPMAKEMVATTVSTDMQDRMEQIRQKVLSRDYLMQMMETYKLHVGDRKSMPPERVVEYMRDEIEMKLDRGWGPGTPNTFKVAVSSKDAEASAAVANHLAEFFISENQRQREGQAGTASDFFDTRMAEAKIQIEKSEENLNRFKTTYAGQLPQQQEALLAQLSQSRTQLQGVQDALSRSAQNRLLMNNSLELARNAELSTRRLLEQTIAGRKRVTVTASGTTANVPGLTESQRLQGELNALRQRYGEKHPDVRRAMTRYEEAKAREAAEPQPVVENAKPGAPVTEDLPLSVALDGPERDLRMALTQEHDKAETLAAQIKVAEQDEIKLAGERIRVLGEIGDLEGRIRNLPMREQEMASVLRDYEMGKDNYKSMVDKKLAADLSRQLEESRDSQQFRILDAARVPEEPIKPKRSLLAMGGSVVGLLLGLVAAVALEMRTQVMLGEWELPPGTPVLGRVIELPIADRGPRQVLADKRPRKRIQSA